MESFRRLAFGLSIVFGCLLLALLAEVCYLLWWRKRVAADSLTDEAEDVNENSSYVKEIIYFICSKGTSHLNRSSSGGRLRQSDSNGLEEQDPEIGRSSKNLQVNSEEVEEETVEAELMRLHNLAGPPRFLFTIKEEAREGMESEEGKSTRSRTRSLSDLVGLEIQQVSPLSSIPSPISNPSSDAGFRFNPPVVNASSPPPKLKFLRDAEEKLMRRLTEEVGVKRSGGCDYGSILKIGVVDTKGRAQVLPLASSPTANSGCTDDQKPASFHWPR
ncbi:hypothetical protein SAY86_002711 [Trapa natans]|uniref:Uncharacterized protein n=1 Tax=Trapa natans TaxID=22666 RepID=A0AAN7LU73_TRANT|nr:hypothetical protein SAY86_002711 [Trapa natans]